MTEVQQPREKRSRRGFGLMHSRKSHHHGTITSNTVQEDVGKSFKEDSQEAPVSHETKESAMLKAKYHRQLASCKELFPDWTEDDILYAIQEASGDFEVAITRISEGRAGKWGEVKKKTKDKTKKQDPLHTSSLSAGGSNKSSRDKVRDPKSLKDSKKRDIGRSNGVSRRNRQTVSDSTSTWDIVKNTETCKESIEPTCPSHAIKSSWPIYQQSRDSMETCQNAKKNLDDKVRIEYDLKKTENTTWEDVNPANQDSGSVSAWSDAATKASSVTAGWGESGSFYVSNIESQNSTLSKSKTKILPSGSKPSWASLLKQESAPDIQEQQISPVSRTSFRSDENFTNTFPISKLTEKNDREIVNGVNHVSVVSKTSLTASNLESINKENIEHVISSKNIKNSMSTTTQPLMNNSTRFHGFNKSHSSKGSYHRHLNQDTPVVMQNPGNISKRVEVQFGSLNLAGQENGLFLNKERSKSESTSISQGVPVNLRSPIVSALQPSQSIENSGQADIRQQSEEMYPDSSNVTQQHLLLNRTATLPSNLNKTNQQISLPEQKHVQYEPFDQSSYANYINHQIQDQALNYRNFSLPGEYQGFYGSEDPRPHFAQGYYDLSAFPREHMSNTSMHRDTSNMANEYMRMSRFDPGVSENSTIPSQNSAPVMPKHISTVPNTVSQHHSSTQGHFHQTQTYSIHPYYNPYATYYMNQYGYGNYPYTKKNIYNQPQQDYHRSYNENSYAGPETGEKFNEHRSSISRPTNHGKSQEYTGPKTQNPVVKQQTQWPPQKKNVTNNTLEYNNEKLNTVSHQGNQGNPLQQIQKFQSSIRPIYPGSSHPYHTHFSQQPQQPHQGASTQPVTTQVQPSASYSMHGHTIGYHGPYQPLMNRQDHPNTNWTSYTSR